MLYGVAIFSSASEFCRCSTSNGFSDFLELFLDLWPRLTALCWPFLSLRRRVEVFVRSNISEHVLCDNRYHVSGKHAEKVILDSTPKNP